jgi:DNA polymerase-3 subunit delta'
MMPGRGACSPTATIERGLDDSGKRLRTRIVIGDVRKATRFLTLTAAEGGWRVVIVDGAEEMNVNAANALLKTLEEPPPRTVLLLVSHAPGRLAATIRSRCRKLSLAPLGDDRVAALIARYRPELDANEALALAIIAEGSAGRALTLAASGGIALYNDMLALLATLPELDIPRLHGTAERIARARAEDGPMAAFDVFTDLLLWWIARLVASRARGSEAPEVVPGESAVMARLAGLQGLDRWGEVWENLSHFVDRAVRLNLDRKQVLLDVFFTLARVGP